MTENAVYSRLRDHQLQTYEKLPSVLTYLQNDLPDGTLDTGTLFAKTLTRLEHLQNLFFIYRLLVKARGEQTDYLQLLEVSYEMLQITLAMWTGGNRLQSLQYSFGWIVVSYGCPAAGVLCSELLKPASALDLQDCSIRKSDIILHLSLLTGFLNWIGMDAPNSNLCIHVKEIVHRVLDQSLNSTRWHPAQGQSSLDNELLPSQAPALDLEYAQELSDYFPFELLDTFDWLRTDS